MGVAMHKTTQKGRPTEVHDDDARTITWIMTTGTTDRDNETVDPQGGVFDDYLRNPAVQFNHDTDDFPIGRLTGAPWNDYIGEGTRYASVGGPKRMALLGNVQFSKENPKGDLAYRMAKEGTLGGGSISFLPMGNTKKNREGGNHYDRWKLLEFTVCPVGSNPDAVAVAKRLRPELKALPEGPFINDAGWSTGEYYIVSDVRNGQIVTVVVRNGQQKDEGQVHENRRAALAWLRDNGFTLRKAVRKAVVSYHKGKWWVDDDKGRVRGPYDTREEAERVAAEPAKSLEECVDDFAEQVTSEQSDDVKKGRRIPPFDPEKYQLRPGIYVYAREYIHGTDGSLIARSGDKLKIVSDGPPWIAENALGQRGYVSIANVRRSLMRKRVWKKGNQAWVLKSDADDPEMDKYLEERGLNDVHIDDAEPPSDAGYEEIGIDAPEKVETAAVRIKLPPEVAGETDPEKQREAVAAFLAALAKMQYRVEGEELVLEQGEAKAFDEQLDPMAKPPDAKPLGIAPINAEQTRQEIQKAGIIAKVYQRGDELVVDFPQRRAGDVGLILRKRYGHLARRVSATRFTVSKRADAERKLKSALQDCVSAKIGRLIGEGYDRKQAAAIAYSYCGEKAIRTGVHKSLVDGVRDDVIGHVAGSRPARPLRSDRDARSMDDYYYSERPRRRGVDYSLDTPDRVNKEDHMVFNDADWIKAGLRELGIRSTARDSGSGVMVKIESVSPNDQHAAYRFLHDHYGSDLEMRGAGQFRVRKSVRRKTKDAEVDTDGVQDAIKRANARWSSIRKTDTGVEVKFHGDEDLVKAFEELAKKFGAERVSIESKDTLSVHSTKKPEVTEAPKDQPAAQPIQPAAEPMKPLEQMSKSKKDDADRMLIECKALQDAAALVEGDLREALLARAEGMKSKSDEFDSESFEDELLDAPPPTTVDGEDVLTPEDEALLDAVVKKLDVEVKRTNDVLYRATGMRIAK